MTSPATSPGSDLGTGPRVRDHFPCWLRVFPGRDDQVREVRRWLAGLVPAVPERDDVIVVAVELVTNAIRHTASGRGGLVMVEVTWCGTALRVAVADDGVPDGPRPRGAGARGGPGQPGGGTPRRAHSGA
jgi:anti-sigma regulatory factor (Ser/Thr protein kinase)